MESKYFTKLSRTILREEHRIYLTHATQTPLSLNHFGGPNAPGREAHFPQTAGSIQRAILSHYNNYILSENTQVPRKGISVHSKTSLGDILTKPRAFITTEPKECIKQTLVKVSPSENLNIINFKTSHSINSRN